MMSPRRQDSCIHGLVPSESYLPPGPELDLSHFAAHYAIMAQVCPVASIPIIKTPAKCRLCRANVPLARVNATFSA
jgi:hypothetical protein